MTFSTFRHYLTSLQSYFRTQYPPAAQAKIWAAYKDLPEGSMFTICAALKRDRAVSNPPTVEELEKAADLEFYKQWRRKAESVGAVFPPEPVSREEQVGVEIERRGIRAVIDSILKRPNEGGSK